MTTEEIVAQLEPWLAKHRRPAWKPIFQEGDGPPTASKFSKRARFRTIAEIRG
jgi:hypothetical protein